MGNVLQLVACASCWGPCTDTRHSFDSFCLIVMKRLREMDLLKKEDIKEYKLLEYSMHDWADQRFEYLVDWDPEALKDICICELSWHIDLHFEVAFNAGIKYFPQHIGNLACRYISSCTKKDEA
jgi:hypothetical protein